MCARARRRETFSSGIRRRGLANCTAFTRSQTPKCEITVLPVRTCARARENRNEIRALSARESSSCQARDKRRRDISRRSHCSPENNAKVNEAILSPAVLNTLIPRRGPFSDYNEGKVDGCLKRNPLRPVFVVMQPHYTLTDSAQPALLFSSRSISQK